MPGSTTCRRIKGLGGTAKRAELTAVLELARRALAERLKERAVFDSPDAVKHYLQLHIAARPHEVFAALFLDAQHRLIAMEELFRGTLTQTSVYPREVVMRALHHHAAAVVLAHFVARHKMRLLCTDSLCGHAPPHSSLRWRARTRAQHNDDAGALAML